MSIRTLDKRALTILEAAEYACVSRGIVGAWLAKGLLPYEELPGNGSGSYRFRRIRKADLDEFLDRCHKDATAFHARRTEQKVTLLPRSS